MEFHRGRLFDHVHLHVSDLEASKRFYRAVLASLGLPNVVEGTGLLMPTSSPRAGGRDNGGPGERSYHPGYYAAFVLDPDGNNVEAVFHGPAARSAPSVVLTPAS